MELSAPRRIGVPPKSESQFVTHLNAASEEWSLERELAALPDFLQPNNPAGDKPPVPAQHSINRRHRGARRQ